MQSFIGNDLISLQDKENYSPLENPSYLKRVLSNSELNQLQPQKFFSYWSSKEALYKALKQKDPAIFFSPKEMSTLSLERKGSFGLLKLLYRREVYDVKIEYTKDWIHAWAILSPSKNSILNLKMGVALNSSIASASSDLRMKIKEIISPHLDVDQNSIEIIRERSANSALLYPKIFLHQKELKNYSLSFSHDGIYHAYALSITSY